MLSKRTFISLIFLLGLCLFTFVKPKTSYSLDCEGIADASQRLQCLENAQSATHQQGETLKSEIGYMDSQISLNQTQIQQSEEKIVQTQKEMEILDSRIGGLDSSLDYLSKLMLNKIVEGYKKNTSLSLIDILLDSGNADSLIDRIKYMQTVQNNNQKLLVQVQETKLNFEKQKALREKKKEELDNLITVLDQQKNELRVKQEAKKNLLAETQGEEAVYQNLIEKAKQELAGFSAFTQSAGGGLTSFGSGSNGWYYTQRDPAWGSMLLPGSSSSVILAGCAVTSVAMVCKSYGQGTTPASIVSNPNNFIYGDLWNWAFGCSGKTTEWIGSSQDAVKSYVKNGTPVILRLSAASVSGLHFVVAWKWDDAANDFIIHDPYYGPDKKFQERYTWYQVTNAVAIH